MAPLTACHITSRHSGNYDPILMKNGRSNKEDVRMMPVPSNFNKVKGQGQQMKLHGKPLFRDIF